MRCPNEGTPLPLRAHRVISVPRNYWSLSDEADINPGTSQNGIYDGVDAPPTASMCQSGGVEHHLREASVSDGGHAPIHLAPRKAPDGQISCRDKNLSSPF